MHEYKYIAILGGQHWCVCVGSHILTGDLKQRGQWSPGLVKVPRFKVYTKPMGSVAKKTNRRGTITGPQLQVFNVGFFKRENT